METSIRYLLKNIMLAGLFQERIIFLLTIMVREDLFPRTSMMKYKARAVELSLIPDITELMKTEAELRSAKILLTRHIKKKGMLKTYA